MKKAPPRRPPGELPNPVAAFARRYASVAPGWKDLFGVKPTWQDVLDRIRRYPIDQLLLLVGQVNAVLDEFNGPEGQARLCSDLFTPEGEEVWGRLVRFANGEVFIDSNRPPVLFHSAQALMLSKLALVYQSHEFSTPCNTLRPFGEALLMLSDMIEPEQPYTFEGTAALMIASSLFTHEDRALHGLGRSIEMYMTDRPDLHKHPSYVDLPKELKRITGLEPELVWLMFLALCGHLKARPISEAWQPFNIESYFHVRSESAVADDDATITKDEAKRLAHLLSASIPELAKQIKNREFSLETARLYDLSEFAEFPFVHHAGKDICISQNLLFKKIINGLHYLFLNRDMTTHKERNRYLLYRGAVFERYVDSILRRCFPAESGFYTGLMTPPVVNGKTGACCDAAWLSGDALVLFEIKGMQFDSDARMGVSERLNKKFEEIFFRSTYQLDATIRSFKDGTLRIGDVDPSKIKRFFPIVITLENFVMQPITHEAIMRELTNRNLLKETGTRPLQLLNVSELENLEVGLARGLKLLHILAKKHDMDEWRGVGFHNFFLHQYPNIFKDTRNAHLAEVFERVKNRAVTLLQERMHREDKGICTREPSPE